MDIKTTLDYLKSKIPTFTSEIKKNSALFTCPNIANHDYKSDNPTATFINGTDKINCLQCDWIGSLFDIVRLLEDDKKDWEDARITAYLLDKCNVDIYKELKDYEKYGWSLFPLAKNSNTPLEGQSWKANSTTNKFSWIKWLERGDNIAVDCEKSKILVVDVDVYKEIKDPELKKKQLELIEALKSVKTLMQNTKSGGVHFVFNAIEGFKNWVDLGGLFIDIRTVGGQLTVAPTKVLGKNYCWINLGAKIKDLPEEIKVQLLELPKNKLDTIKYTSLEAPKVLQVEAGEGRNNNLTSIGGIVANRFSEQPEIVEWFLQLINQKFHNPPLPTFEVKNIVQSLAGYKKNETLSQKEAILNILKQMGIPMSARDVLENLPNKKLTIALVNKYFSELHKEGEIVHWHRGVYKVNESLEWKSSISSIGNAYPYKIPLFNHLMDFEQGDFLILGGRQGAGKSHIALNIIKQIVAQGVKPYYISLESGSRYGKIACALDLLYSECCQASVKLVDNKYFCTKCEKNIAPQTKFYVEEHDNPIKISLEPNAFTVIDWLNINEFEKTNEIYEHFKNEMQIKKGVLVVFTQLKEDYTFFAPNLIQNFPAFVARYQFDNNERTEGHWNVDKLREPKGNFWNAHVGCLYDPQTKIFKVKDV